jgi:four helix bundle protein
MEAPHRKDFNDGMGFENLRVYQAAQKLEEEVQRLIAEIPRGHSKDIDHLNRAMGSVLFNIPEAFGCEDPGRKRNHLEIARGSSDEVRGVLRRFVGKKVLTESGIRRACELSSVVAKMLTAWIAALIRVQ